MQRKFWRRYKIMVFVQVCVGSSCHLKGSPQIVELLRRDIEKHQLEEEVVLTGNLCIGKCNREGVTIQIDDEVVCGVNRENFAEFYREHITKPFKGGVLGNG